MEGGEGERYVIYFKIITKQYIDAWIELILHKHFPSSGIL